MIDRSIANELATQIKNLRRDLEQQYKTGGIHKQLKMFKKEPMARDAALEMFIKKFSTDVKRSGKFADINIKTINNLVKGYIIETEKKQMKLYESMRKNLEGVSGFLKGEMSKILGEAEGVFKFVKDITMLILKPFAKFTWNRILLPLGKWIKGGWDKLTDKVKEKGGIKKIVKDSLTKKIEKIPNYYRDLVNTQKKFLSRFEKILASKYEKKVHSRLFNDKDKEITSDSIGFTDIAAGSLAASFVKSVLGKVGTALGAAGRFATGAMTTAGGMPYFLPFALGGTAVAGATGAYKALKNPEKYGGNWTDNASGLMIPEAQSNAAAPEYIGKSTQSIYTAMVDTGEAIKGWYNTAIEKIDEWTLKFANWFDNIFKVTWESLSGFGKTISNWFESGVDWVKDSFESSKKIFNNIIEGIDNDWGKKFTESVTGFFTKATDMFNNLWASVKNLPNNIASGASNMMFGNPNAGVNTGNNLIASPGGNVNAIPAQYVDLIKKSAEASGFSPALIAGLIQQESRWNPNAVSPKGARGLGQFMPGTAQALGIDPNNPEQAIMGIGRYLKDVKETLIRKGMANPSIENILAGYNAGPGNVLKHGGIPPFAETQKYVPEVLRNAAQYGGTGSGGLFGMASNMAGSVYSAFANSLQAAIDKGVHYGHGGKNFETGQLDCSGFVDWMMGNSLSQVNKTIADQYKAGAAGQAAGKAQRIAQTFGVPLIEPGSLNPETLAKMGAGTVLSRTSAGSQGNQQWTGHNAVVTTDQNGNLVVAETTGGNKPMKMTPLNEWWGYKDNSFYAANPLLSAAGNVSPAGSIQDSTLRGIENQARIQQAMVTNMEELKKQQVEIPKAFVSVAQMVNSNRSGGDSVTRQVLSPPENIMEGQYTLFALNSTYNE